MKIKDKLMKHVKSMKDEYIKAYDAIDEETERHNQAVKKLKEEKTELSQEAHSRKHLEEETLHAGNMKFINETLQEKIDAFWNACMQDIQEFYAPKGSDLDEADCALLKSGIILSNDELSNMIEKYGDNTTMLRAIEVYEKEHFKEIELSFEQKAIVMKAKRAGTAEREILSSFLQLAGNCVRMGMQGMVGLEPYIKCRNSIDEYVDQTENGLNKVKIFIDEETRKELEKYELEQIAKNNKV